jgi:hypothetical protein
MPVLQIDSFELPPYFFPAGNRLESVPSELGLMAELSYLGIGEYDASIGRDSIMPALQIDSSELPLYFASS